MVTSYTANTSKPTPSVQDADIRLLRIFIAVVRNNGFSAAQTELNIGPSTISESISKLEVRYGISLCDRGRAGFKLTTQGSKFYDAAIAFFENLENFRAVVSRIRNEISGRLFLGVVDGIATIDDLSLKKALKTLDKNAPLVELELKIDSPQALISGIQSGRYDAAVLPIFRDIPGLNKIQLYPLVRQTLYCGLDHPFYDLPDKEISNHKLSEASFAARKHMEGYQYRNKNKFNERAWTTDMECLALLILSGRFIGYLPDPFARQWVNDGLMRKILESTHSYEAKLYLVTSATDISNATKYLCDCVSNLT